MLVISVLEEQAQAAGSSQTLAFCMFRACTFKDQGVALFSAVLVAYTPLKPRHQNHTLQPQNIRHSWSFSRREKVSGLNTEIHSALYSRSDIDSTNLVFVLDQTTSQSHFGQKAFSNWDIV